MHVAGYREKKLVVLVLALRTIKCVAIILDLNAIDKSLHLINTIWEGIIFIFEVNQKMSLNNKL